MNFKNSLSLIAAYNGVKLIESGPLHYLSTKEFDKWLNYFSDEQKQRIDYLCGKEIEDLTKSEVEEIINFKNDMYLASIANNFENENTSLDDRLKYLKFTKQSNLEDLIRRKLTVEGFNLAKEKANKLISELSYYDLSEYASSQKEDFDNLSMIDTLVLRLISKKINAISSKKGLEEIKIIKDSIEAAEQRYEYNKRY